MDYSLVLRNGHVIDPSQGINRRMDLAVQAGRIAASATRSSSSRYVQSRALVTRMSDLVAGIPLAR